MKTAVDRVGAGKKRNICLRFMAMTSHYVFEPDFCNPAAGWEKGQVEKNVRDARHRLWQVMPAFPDLDALNLWLEERCKAIWAEAAHGSLPGSIAEVWLGFAHLLIFSGVRAPVFVALTAITIYAGARFGGAMY